MAFCSNCGTELPEGAVFCTECGTPVTKAETAPVAESAPVAVGVTQTAEVVPAAATATVEATAKPVNAGPVSKKSRLITFLLGLFLGSFGAHNFYRGKIGIAVTQLILTIGGFIFDIMGSGIMAANYYDDGMIALGVLVMLLGVIMMMVSGIWSFVEWILAACGALKDKEGLPITVWME